MVMQFVQARRSQAKARLALVGLAGAGKTYSALRIAAGLGCQRIAIADSERGKAEKAAGRGVNFGWSPLPNHSPAIYCDALESAAKANIDGLIIDSLSDEWEGDQGMLEMVESKARTSDSSDERGIWKKLNAEHKHLFDLILQYPGHVIVTVRARKAREADRKRQLEAIQREGWDYYFDVIGMLDLEHRLTVTKSCCEALPRGAVLPQAADVGQRFGAWLRGSAETRPEPSARAHEGNGVAVAAVAGD